MFRMILTVIFTLSCSGAFAQKFKWEGGFSVGDRYGNVTSKYEKASGEGPEGKGFVLGVRDGVAHDYIAALDWEGGNHRRPCAVCKPPVHVAEKVVVPVYSPPPYVYDPDYYYYGYPPYRAYDGRYYWGAPVRRW